MASVPVTNDALSRTFTTALLLTGSAERAEAAVLEGIRVMDRSRVSAEALLRTTGEASISAKIPCERVEEKESASSLLPVELRRVLRLPPDFRRCFVLRVLVGLSREVCARMLQTEIHRVDELVCVSARALAGLSKEKASRWECLTEMSGHGS